MHKYHGLCNNAMNKKNQTIKYSRWYWVEEPRCECTLIWIRHSTIDRSHGWDVFHFLPQTDDSFWISTHFLHNIKLNFFFWISTIRIPFRLLLMNEWHSWIFIWLQSSILMTLSFQFDRLNGNYFWLDRKFEQAISE